MKEKGGGKRDGWLFYLHFSDIKENARKFLQRRGKEKAHSPFFSVKEPSRPRLRAGERKEGADPGEQRNRTRERTASSSHGEEGRECKASCEYRTIGGHIPGRGGRKSHRKRKRPCLRPL